MLLARGKPVTLSPQVLVGLVAAALAIAFSSMLLASHNASRDEASARQRIADVQQLLALPPSTEGELTAQLDWAKAELAAWKAQPTSPDVDPASDAATALLVRHATAAGLQVRGVSRIDPATARLGELDYKVQALRLSLSGTPAQIAAYLSDMRDTEPAMFPSLVSLSIDKEGLAVAEVAFETYEAVPTPGAVPNASGTPGVRR